MERVPGSPSLDETSPHYHPAGLSTLQTNQASRNTTQTCTSYQAKQSIMPRYSDWPEIQNGEVFKGENYPVGKGLGIINPKNFEPATWTPLLKSATGQGQYGRFIALMMGRINLQESPPDEVRSFVNMVTSDVSHDLLYYALPHMPDWTKGP